MACSYIKIKKKKIGKNNIQNPSYFRLDVLNLNVRQTIK